jgi:hypothetical protein
MHIGYWWESQKERDNWEDQDVGRLDNIKMDLREIGWDGRDWIEVAQDRDQWRALVNTVMNLQVPYNCWEFSEWLDNWQLFRKGSAPYVSK